MDFAHYQSPKLLGSSPPMTQVSIFGTLSISGQIHRETVRARIVAITRFILDGRQKVKSNIVWDFSDIRKPGFIRYIWDGRQRVKSPIAWDFPDI